MKFAECISLIFSDYQRISQIGNNKSGFFHFLRCYLVNDSLKTMFWVRIGKYIEESHCFCKRVILVAIQLIQIHYKHKTGIEIHFNTEVGKGLRFAHSGTIIVAGGVVIGDNCTIHQCVTIGRTFAGIKLGCPIIGDNVVIFPGATLIGNIHIGNNAIIGANSLVIDDVPSNSIVGGNPAKVLCNDSSNAIDFEWKKYFYVQ